MTAKKFCSSCGQGLALGGNPECVVCRPKSAALKFAVITHNVGRSKYTQPFLLRLDQWKIAEIEKETPTLIHVTGAGFSMYDRRHHQREAPMRYATRGEAEAFLARAKAQAVDAEAAQKTAKDALEAARELERDADRAFRAVGAVAYEAEIERRKDQ